MNFCNGLTRRSVIVVCAGQPARQAIEPLSIPQQLVHFMRGVRYRGQRVACWQRTSLVPAAKGTLCRMRLCSNELCQVVLIPPRNTLHL
jgi:hypothetical protein